MLEGMIKRTKAAIEALKRYLADNADNLTEQQINEALDELASLMETLEHLQGP